MAALEAMACGLPWVGPPVGALADIPLLSRDKPSGIIFKARDPRQVAVAMCSLVEPSQAERLAFGMAARNVTESNYEMARQAIAFVQLIDQLTEG
jgi:glycosyltransferase involved in cell wall biosynthesis